MGVSQNYGYHFGVPAVRTVVFWGLYWDPPILGNYHIMRILAPCMGTPISAKTLNPKPSRLSESSTPSESATASSSRMIWLCHMSHSLNSSMGGYIEDYKGDYYRGY